MAARIVSVLLQLRVLRLGLFQDGDVVDQRPIARTPQ